MDDNDNPELVLKIGGDATGAQAATDETLTGLQGLKQATGDVGGAAEGAAPEVSKLVHEAGGMRESQRVAHDLANILKGELSAGIEGVTGLMRVLLATSEGMDPIVLALTIVTTSLVGIVAGQQAHNEKLGEGKQKTDDLKVATEDLKTETENLKAPVDVMLDREKQIEESLKNQLQALKDQQAEASALIAINKEMAIERARADYLAGNKPGMSDEELEGRKKQFEATKADITDQSTVATATLAYEDKAQLAANAQRQIASTQDSKEANRQEIQRAQDKSADARNFLANNEIAVDDKGTATATDPANGKQIDIVAEFKKRIAESQADANRIREGLRLNQYMPRDVESTQKALAEYDEQIAKSQQSLDQVQNALADLPAEKEARAKLEPKMAEQDSKIEELRAQVATLTAALHGLAKAKDAAASQKLNDEEQRRQETEREAARQARELADREFAGQNKAAIEAQEQIRDNKKSSPAQVGAADKEIERLRNAALEREIAEKSPQGNNSSESDFTSKYNTPLTPDQEAQYQKWLQQKGMAEGESYDYDMRGAWLNNAKQADNGHFPDTYKKPNHPTFSDQSKYSGKDGFQGGQWSEDSDPNKSFRASYTNTQMHSPEELENYFKKKEPDYKLILPPIDPTKPLVPGEIAALKGQESLNTQKGGNQADAASVAAQKHQDEIDRKAEADKKKTDTEHLNLVKSAIYAGGDATAIAEMRKIVLEDKGNLSKQIADLLSVHITTQTQINSETAAKLKKLDSNQKDHKKGLDNYGH